MKSLDWLTKIRRRLQPALRRGPFLAAAAIPPLLGMALLSVMVVTDPYDMRPWGSDFDYGDISQYPIEEIPRQIRVRTAQPQEVVLFGGSTTMDVTTEQLQRAFHARRVVNLSYALPAARDAGIVMERIARTPSLRRMIVSVNHSQMVPDGRLFPPGETAVSILEGEWFEAPDFSMQSALATMEALVSGNFATEGWAKTRSDWSANFRSLPEDQPTYRRLLAAHRSPRYANGPMPAADCRRYPFVSQMLPAIRTAVRRGVQVDILFPPIPYQTYALWEFRAPGGAAFLRGSPVSQIADFHACIVLALERERLPGVRVHAEDIDEATITNLGNYRDTVHLLSNDAISRVMQNVAEGRHVLTSENLPGYRATLLAGVYGNAGQRRLPAAP